MSEVTCASSNAISGTVPFFRATGVELCYLCKRSLTLFFTSIVPPLSLSFTPSLLYTGHSLFPSPPLSLFISPFIPYTGPSLSLSLSLHSPLPLFPLSLCFSLSVSPSLLSFPPLCSLFFHSLSLSLSLSCSRSLSLLLVPVPPFSQHAFGLSLTTTDPIPHDAEMIFNEI